MIISTKHTVLLIYNQKYIWFQQNLIKCIIIELWDIKNKQNLLNKAIYQKENQFLKKL